MVKSSNHYVNSKELYTHLVKYYEGRERGEDPRMSNYIGKCIELICERIASRPNFSSYSYKNDMIRDGVMHCVAAVPKYNPKFKNPFGYFSRIAWHAFLQRIQEEKRQNYIKHKNFQKIHLFDEYASRGEESHGDVVDNLYNNSVIKDFEDKLLKNKEKKV